MERDEEPGEEAPGQDEAVRSDRRWALRRGVELSADLTDSAGTIYAVRITEISEEGCRIRTFPLPALERDLRHEIKITGLEPLGAYVIWASGDEAGLSFSTPLDPVTVRSLVTKSVYARLSRGLARGGGSQSELGPLPPFPFKD